MGRRWTRYLVDDELRELAEMRLERDILKKAIGICDITYIWTKQGRLYLTVILDLAIPSGPGTK